MAMVLTENNGRSDLPLHQEGVEFGRNTNVFKYLHPAFKRAGHHRRSRDDEAPLAEPILSQQPNIQTWRCTVSLGVTSSIHYGVIFSYFMKIYDNLP
jgi:hypothetical protein